VVESMNDQMMELVR